MPWFNISPRHLTPSDLQTMRTSGEHWWRGRTREHASWEHDCRLILREVCAKKGGAERTGRGILVFAPSWAWFDSQEAGHLWDTYPFDVLVQDTPHGPFHATQYTGKWLRQFTTRTSGAGALEDEAHRFMQTDSHPFCQQHRRQRQLQLVDWQRRIAGSAYAMSRERLLMELRYLAGPDTPILES
jgi:hypothetical protein